MLIRTGALTFALLLAPFASAAAHQQLLGAVPAEGDSLTATPDAIQLSFNQRVEIALARLTLTGPAGPVELGPLQVPADSATVLTAAIAGEMVAGEYLVEWLVTGDDGHPVRGEIRFVVREGAEGLALPAAAAVESPPAGTSSAADMADGGPPEGRPAPEGRFDSASPPYVAARWINFAGIVAAIGAAAFALLLIPQLLRRGISRSSGVDAALRRAAGVGAAAAGVLVVALALRLAAQTAAMGAGGGTDSTGIVTALLGRTVWGWGWLLQVLAVVLLLLGFGGARRGHSSAWKLAAVGALLLSITPALSGHAAATSPLAVAADALHVLGAGGWLGTLLVMLIASPPLLRAPERGGEAGSAATLLTAFSPLALSFAGLLTLTGVYSAWLHLPETASLWTSSYGRLLLVKLGVLMLVFSAGAYNWRRVRPRVRISGDFRPLRGSATAELLGAAVVLAVTAALVATPPPTEEADLAGGTPPPSSALSPAEAPR